jgi:inorganic pyrophosphatase/exopolyphosphatase
MATEADVKVVEKVLDLAKKELSLEEYARFLAFIGPKAGDTVKEIRRFRDQVGAEEFIKRLKKRGVNINP